MPFGPDTFFSPRLLPRLLRAPFRDADVCAWGGGEQNHERAGELAGITH